MGRTQNEVNENRVLSKVFGSKRKEITEDWRRLYKEEFHDSPPNQLLLFG
jgi:hypothetical protein